MILAALLLAQTAPACAVMDVNLPAPLAGWTAAATKRFTPGLPYLSSTIDPAAPAIVAPSPGDPKPEGRYTVFMFTVKAPGTYRIALDQPGWIDVKTVGGVELKSVGHGHGPACSSIRKIVDFKLEAGAHYLRLTRLAQPQAKVMLIAP